MAILRDDEMNRVAATRCLREHLLSTLKLSIRDDLDEAVANGVLSREETADEAIKAIIGWKA